VFFDDNIANVRSESYRDDCKWNFQRRGQKK
jgi:hypothetical protein